MNYPEALDFIHGTHRFGMKLGLETMKNLMDLLDNPQEKLKFIHIAGTNGKGSTSAMIHSILKEQGYRVGLFISPYLEEFTERIQINGENIEKKVLADITKRVKEKIDIMLSLGMQHPTEFELVTAIGLVYFAQKQVDFVVLEVGLGGRFDATNIISKTEVSVITSIGWDHMAQLGNTLEEIAGEKAGIIKEGGNVVVYPQQREVARVITQKAQEKEANTYFVQESTFTTVESSLAGQVFSYRGDLLSLPKIEITLLGRHQIYNAATVLKAVEVLQQKGHSISKEAILKGLKNARWPGRLEIVSKEPFILLDGAHNLQGAQAFSRSIKEYFPGKKITLIVGMLKDKDIEKIIIELLPIAKEIITVMPNNPRAMSAQDLTEKIQDIDSKIKCKSIESVQQAVQWVKNKRPEEVIAFTGSLYMIGEVRKMLNEIK